VIGRETLRIAWGGIAANKLRSGLTILGMTIGVAAVIVLIAVGNGAAAAVQARIQSLGTNVLVVLPSGGGFRGGARASAAGRLSLTRQDAAALESRSEAPDVQSASPVVNATGVRLVYGSSSYEPSSFLGTTPSYLSAHAYHVQEGESFTAADVARHERVAVIGQTVAQELFGGQAAVGQTMRVDGTSFQVLGVLAAKGTSGTANEDDVVMAPVTTVQDALTGVGAIDSITVQARSESALGAAEAEVTQIIEERHHERVAQPAEGGRAGAGGILFNQASDTAEPGFQVLNQGSLLETSSSTSSVFTTLLGEVAAISLLVGGIGVMNIMLVSVTERTREIGIRKAIGARRSDILTQFLAEALLVSLCGGLLGVAVGVGASQFTIAGVQPQIATYSLFLAFGAAGASGLFFGTYPAARAATLRPIEALRYE
jgi:putative ABC transport system permease protein